MMLLSEIARREGLFDWAAALAIAKAVGSPKRLFLLIYGVGVAVTAFLSNDAAAVVLTPAVFAASRKAKVEPSPYLFICALVANGASFVLPISNPANLVLYGDHTPPLGRWLASFALPSALSILVTYVVLLGGALKARRRLRARGGAAGALRRRLEGARGPGRHRGRAARRVGAGPAARPADLPAGGG